MSSDYPLARSEGLITEELDGELLVYDSDSNMAHALDADAVSVWRACDGQTDSGALAVRCTTSEEDVRSILARLGELGLLEDAQAEEDGDTRRSALRKIGIAGVGVATISSILVPTVAAAGSCLAPGVCTQSAASCCNGQTVPFFGCGPSGNVCCAPAGTCAPIMQFRGGTFCCNGAFPTFDSSCPTGFRCRT
jgi:hypothetical protein